MGLGQYFEIVSLLLYDGEIVQNSSPVRLGNVGLILSAVETSWVDFVSHGIVASSIIGVASSLGQKAFPTAEIQARSTAATVVYELIKSDILTGRLEPGLKLRIDQLATMYEIGSSPIREALNRLTADSLVDRQEQRGFYVAKASAQELREIVKTRLWLEAIALRESIANADQRWEDNLVLALHRLSHTKRSLSETEYKLNPEWESRHAAFHEALIANSGSALLFKYCQDLRRKSDRYRLLATSSIPARSELDEHRAIFEAAIAGQFERAIDLLCSHYTITQTIIEKRFIDSA